MESLRSITDSEHILAEEMANDKAEAKFDRKK